MKCPCCNNKMKDKSKFVEQRIVDFSGTHDYDFETVLSTRYKCKECDIKYKDGKWDIPGTVPERYIKIFRRSKRRKNYS